MNGCITAVLNSSYIFYHIKPEVSISCFEVCQQSLPLEYATAIWVSEFHYTLQGCVSPKSKRLQKQLYRSVVGLLRLKPNVPNTNRMIVSAIIHRQKRFKKRFRNAFWPVRSHHPVIHLHFFEDGLWTSESKGWICQNCWSTKKSCKKYWSTKKTLQKLLINKKISKKMEKCWSTKNAVQKLLINKKSLQKMLINKSCKIEYLILPKKHVSTGGNSRKIFPAP